MALSKDEIVVINSVSNAAAGSTTATGVDLSSYSSCAAYIKITNGATGPTIAANVQMQCSTDNSGWFDIGGPLLSNTGNSAVTSWGGIPIPAGVIWFRAVVSGNTGQAVTARVLVAGFLQT